MLRSGVFRNLRRTDESHDTPSDKDEKNDKNNELYDFFGHE